MPNDTIDGMRQDAKLSALEKRVDVLEKDVGEIKNSCAANETQVNEIYLKLVGDLDNKGMITEFREMCTAVTNLITKMEEKEKEKKKTKIDWIQWIERTIIAGLFGYMFTKLHLIIKG